MKVISPISIHALRAERDANGPAVIATLKKISIHALRAERDGIPLPTAAFAGNFNPRAPSGARHSKGSPKDDG